jgi:hypothetical protein
MKSWLGGLRMKAKADGQFGITSATKLTAPGLEPGAWLCAVASSRAPGVVALYPLTQPRRRGQLRSVHWRPACVPVQRPRETPGCSPDRPLCSTDGGLTRSFDPTQMSSVTFALVHAYPLPRRTVIAPGRCTRLARQLALIRCGDCDPSVRLDWERAADLN